MAASTKDYQARAANDIDLIERDKMANAEQLRTKIAQKITPAEKALKQKQNIKQAARSFNEAVPKEEVHEARSLVYEKDREIAELRKQLESAKSELKNRHVFGRLSNMNEEKVSFTMSLPKTFNSLLEKESRKANMSKTQFSRLAVINMLIEKGHDIIFEADIG